MLGFGFRVDSKNHLLPSMEGMVETIEHGEHRVVEGRFLNKSRGLGFRRFWMAKRIQHRARIFLNEDSWLSR